MSDLTLPSVPPEVEAYLRRTGHSFEYEWTSEDGYIVSEFDRHHVKIATCVLGRFVGEPPVAFVLDAMRSLAGVKCA